MASRSVWKERVEDWKRSRLPAAEYAGRIGVRATTLSWWSYKLEREAKQRTAALESRIVVEKRPGRASSRARPRRAKSPKLSFVELEAPMVREPIEVLLPSGERVRVARDFDADALRRVLEVLGSTR